MRSHPLSQTRVVGGSTTINSCIWLRGSAADYDGWAAAGNPGWGFAGLLPFFRKSESDPLGIPVVADLPGVGTGLGDHPFLGGLLLNRVLSGHAPAGASSLPTTIEARSGRASEKIDLHLYHGQFFDAERDAWVLVLSLSLAHARPQGWLRLTAADPHAPLTIDHQHLADPAELEALCDGVELVTRLVATPPLADTIEPLPALLPAWRGRDELRAAVRQHVATTFHPSSTCRMGPAADDGAVVNHLGRVHGVPGLRVADASIFPAGPRANLHCTVVAVVEKLAAAMR